jgi:hypothetical protein
MRKVRLKENVIYSCSHRQRFKSDHRTCFLFETLSRQSSVRKQHLMIIVGQANILSASGPFKMDSVVSLRKQNNGFS